MRKETPKNISLAGYQLDRLDVFLHSGAVQTFRHVEVIKDDETFLQFWYLGALDDKRAEGLFNCNSLAGKAWRLA